MKNIDHYREVHKSWTRYGAGSRHFYYVLAGLTYLRARSVLDYGCGKGVLADQLNESQHLRCEKYDPAIPEFDARPEKFFDCVINTDVLEHIPEDELDATLKYFPVLSSNAIVIPHLREAGLVLPNGENAHCTLKKPEEWRAILETYYKNVYLMPHQSDRHAFLFCAQDDVDPAPLEGVLRVLVSVAGDPLLVQARLNDPWKVRFRRAVKLLLGNSALRR